MSDPTPAEIEAVKVLIAHGRTRIEGCDCGWGMDGSKLGQSHALHVWRELQRAVLPDHDARLRAEHEEALRAAGWLPPEQRATRDQADEVLDRVRQQERAKVAEHIAQAIESAGVEPGPPDGVCTEVAAHIARTAPEGDTDEQ